MFSASLWRAGCIAFCLLRMWFGFSDKKWAVFPFEIFHGSLREGCKGSLPDGCFAHHNTDKWAVFPFEIFHGSLREGCKGSLPDGCFAHNNGFSKCGCVGVPITSEAGIFKCICVGACITSDTDIFKCICFCGLVWVRIAVTKGLHQCLVLSRSLDCKI